MITIYVLLTVAISFSLFSMFQNSYAIKQCQPTEQISLDFNSFQQFYEEEQKSRKELIKQVTSNLNQLEERIQFIEEITKNRKIANAS